MADRSVAIIAVACDFIRCSVVAAHPVPVTPWTQPSNHQPSKTLRLGTPFINHRDGTSQGSGHGVHMLNRVFATLIARMSFAAINNLERADVL